jgi:hypothetical protein
MMLGVYSHGLEASMHSLMRRLQVGLAHLMEGGKSKNIYIFILYV